MIDSSQLPDRKRSDVLATSRGAGVHPSEESLERYSLGNLDEADTEIVEEHILLCEGCRVRLDDADRYVRAMRSGTLRLRQEAQQKAKRSANLWWGWIKLPVTGWAVAGAAVCGFVVFANNKPRHPELDSQVVTVSLKAERGGFVTVAAHRKLALRLDARGLVLGKQTRVVVVEARGEMVESVSGSQVAETVELQTTKDLSPGSYYIRLYSPESKEPAREFALTITE